MQRKYSNHEKDKNRKNVELQLKKPKISIFNNIRIKTSVINQDILNSLIEIGI